MPGTVAFYDAALNMVTALGCGAVIGSERQMRQRMAGLRTNALVALGASAFVTFSQLIAVDTSPSRVAAQVVSGIGFLGAGIIFRDGFEVHGLNTAATLWCSAGVGLLAATGQWHFALLLTGLVVFINIGLRPLVKLLKRHTKAGQPIGRLWRLSLNCSAESEGPVRALVLRTLAVAGLELTEVEARRGETGVDLAVLAHGEGITESVFAQTVQRLAAEPQVLRLQWAVIEDG